MILYWPAGAFLAVRTQLAGRRVQTRSTDNDHTLTDRVTLTQCASRKRAHWLLVSGEIASSLSTSSSSSGLIIKWNAYAADTAATTSGCGQQQRGQQRSVGQWVMRLQLLTEWCCHDAAQCHCNRITTSCRIRTNKVGATERRRENHVQLMTDTRTAHTVPNALCGAGVTPATGTRCNTHPSRFLHTPKSKH